MGNLHPRSAYPPDPRPFQQGHVEGVRNQLPVTVAIEWLVDTGANISALTWSKAALFDLTTTAGLASATTGPRGIPLASGVTMVFTVLDSTGVNQQVRCSLPVAIKPSDTGSDILGMDQLAAVNAKVRWDPVALDGDLYR
jgi:hypothetical protein